MTREEIVESFVSVLGPWLSGLMESGEPGNVEEVLSTWPLFSGVLDGTHVIVPKEPTPRMIDAGCSSWERNESRGLGVGLFDVYHAMIEAAQEKM